MNPFKLKSKGYFTPLWKGSLHFKTSRKWFWTLFLTDLLVLLWIGLQIWDQRGWKPILTKFQVFNWTGTWLSRLEVFEFEKCKFEFLSWRTEVRNLKLERSVIETLSLRVRTWVLKVWVQESRFWDCSSSVWGLSKLTLSSWILSSWISVLDFQTSSWRTWTLSFKNSDFRLWVWRIWVEELEFENSELRILGWRTWISELKVEDFEF